MEQSTGVQAVLALREAAIRDWPLLTVEQQLALRTFTLHYLLHNVANLPQLVQSQLTSVLARLLKRGWAEDSPAQKGAFFAEVEGAVASAGDTAARRAAIQLLEVSHQVAQPQEQACSGI